MPCTSPADLCTALDDVVGTLLKLAIAARDFADLPKYSKVISSCRCAISLSTLAL